MKIALIGPGRMGVNYARVIQQTPGAELVAICGNTEENTKKNAAEFNVPLYFNNRWEEMYHHHKEIDTVVIATSEWAHEKPFIDALKNNKNIILEKPVSVSLLDADKMKQALEKTNLKTAVCFTCRFDARYQQAYNLIKQGKLGKIGYIYSKRNADLKVAKRVLGKMPMSFWLTPHDIDLMRWFTQSEVAEVTAFQNKENTSNNYLHVNLLFKNGTRGLIEISWYSNSLTGQSHSQFDIEAEKGRVEVNLSHPAVIAFKQDGAAPEIPDTYDFINIYGKYQGATPTMIRHFIDAFKDGAELQVSFEDGMKTIHVCHAIELSILQAKTISLQ